jgi:hypothetical protein
MKNMTSQDFGKTYSSISHLIVHEALHSPGHPLDIETRSFFEPRFKQDFGNVRVHDNHTAAEAARSIHAEAFTSGRNIAFAPGKYQPETVTGKQLLAHELTHIIQQEKSYSKFNGTKINKKNDNYPTIGPLEGGRLESYLEQQKTFEIQLLSIKIIGPLIKADFRIRHPHNEWQEYNFFGLGTPTAMHIPILNRPSSVMQHKTMHGMRNDQFKGRGWLKLVGIPGTDVQYIWLTFSEGPEKAGYASVTWRLETGVRAKFGAGFYWGSYNYGTSLR